MKGYKSELETLYISYITEESWQYCDRCKTVERNKMLPNYGKQKITCINNCVCEKSS